MKYKVQHISTAYALVAYWQRFNIKVEVKEYGPFVEITGSLPPVTDDTAKAAFGLWREVNDAFVAGRASIAL